MGIRKITVRESAAKSIAAISWFIESKGLIATAEKFTDSAYNYFIKLADDKKFYAVCRDPKRRLLGFKCVPYKKKYTIVFIETGNELIICEFISSKIIYW